MTAARAFGWRKDQPAEDPPAHHLLMRMRDGQGVTLPPLDKSSLLQFRGKPMYQGQAGSCTAFGRASETQLWASANDAPDVPLPSQRHLYEICRRQEWAGHDPDKIPPLFDSGCYPRMVMRAVQTLGYVPWSECPYPTDPTLLGDSIFMADLVNTPVDTSVHMKAYSQRGFEYARINEFGQQRVDLVAEMLRNRAPVGFGFLVDESFLDNRGETVTSIDPYRIVGGHWISVLEVKRQKSGDLVLCDNWWEGHGGAEGLVTFSASVFGSPYIDDVYATRFMPRVKEAA